MFPKGSVQPHAHAAFQAGLGALAQAGDGERPHGAGLEKSLAGKVPVQRSQEQQRH